MNEQTAAGERRSSSSILVISEVILLVVLALIAIGLAQREPGSSQLLPALPPATIPMLTVPAPQAVSLSDLNADPAAYLNQTIQVSGAFLPLTPASCPRRSGPLFRWAVVADNLQLDILGFERVLPLLAPDTQMTLQGVWRFYQGPLGCGKGPAAGTAWYLEAQRILQPNPLVGSDSGGINIESADPGLPALVPTNPPTATLPPTPTFAPQDTAVPDAVDPALGAESPTATLAGSGTALPVLTPTPLSGSVTVTAVSTPGAGTPASTAVTPGTPDNAATPTPSTPLPPTATQTGGGYPGEPTATNEPGPYP